MAEQHCVGCGALVPAGGGPTHAYMLAAPGCWRLYCSLEDWKLTLTGPEAATTTQRLVDTYAVQHPTNPDRRNRQSVAVHLMSLCSSIERNVPGTSLRTMIGSWTHRDYPVLQPPVTFTVTVRKIVDADASMRDRVIAAAAATTWSEWAHQHALVREWLDRPPGAG